MQAVTTDNVILTGLVAGSPDDFELVGNPFTEEPYGIGLKKGDTDFRNFINDVLEESFDDGTWAEAWDRTAGDISGTGGPRAADRSTGTDRSGLVGPGSPAPPALRPTDREGVACRSSPTTSTCCGTPS